MSEREIQSKLSLIKHDLECAEYWFNTLRNQLQNKTISQLLGVLGMLIYHAISLILETLQFISLHFSEKCNGD